MEKWKKKKVCQVEWYFLCEEVQVVCVKRKGGKCVWCYIVDEFCLLDDEDKQIYGCMFMFNDYVYFKFYVYVIF